jgi:hypothetical protein
MWVKSPHHPHRVLVKDATQHDDQQVRGHLRPLAGLPGRTFNSARREVLFHDLAHQFFGLGKHVPTTAGFTDDFGRDLSGQKEAVDSNRIWLGAKQDKIQHPNHERVIKNLNNSGQLDKMTMMDHIMGHHDRHHNNYHVDDKGDNLHLIDNGTAFDYGNLDAHEIPGYRRVHQEQKLHGKDGHDSSKAFHPAAVKWLQQLKPADAIKTFIAHGHGDDSPAIEGFVGRLLHLKNALAKKKKVAPEKVLKEGKEKTHQQLEDFI